MGAPTTVNAAKAWLKKHGQLNERSLAEVYTEEFESRWRYNADEGYWLQWVGTHWASRQTLEFMDALGSFMKDFVQIFRRMDEITHSEAVRFKRQNTIAALEKICRGMPSFLAHSALFDADPFLLGTPGGTVDLRTGDMRPAVPEDYITLLTKVTPAPKGTLCPEWIAFLMEVMDNNTDLMRTMQQWAGVSASGSVRDQRLMFIYGSGRNGKGVYCRTISGLLGDHVAGAPRDLFVEQGHYKRHLAELVNVVTARMVLGSEIPEGATWDVALIKEVTGGDIMEVRRMRQDLFKVKPTCTITIMANLRPELKTIDEAVRSRLLVVTFPVFIPEERRIPDLELRFIEHEGPAILRWIIDGAVDREQMGHLHVAKVIEVDSADYFAEEDIMTDFIQTYFVRAPAGTEEHNRDFWVPTGDAYELWRGYNNRFGRKAGARNPFTTAMKNARIGYKRTADGRYFTGISKRLDI